jgi:hypothetical protein
MRKRKPPWQSVLNIIAWVIVIGLIDLFKRIIIWFINLFRRAIGQRENTINPPLCGNKKTTNKSNNAARTRWNLYWMFWFIIFVVMLIGAVLYIPSLYPVTTSENLTSVGNFQTTFSDNQSINGTIQIQTSNNRSGNGNVFDLAIISGLLGGFALALLTTRERNYPNFLKASLLLQGIFYILATVAFVVFGFYLAADIAKLLANSPQLSQVYQASFYIGIISLSFSVSLTLWSLIRLLFNNWWKRFWNLVIRAISGD